MHRMCDWTFSWCLGLIPLRALTVVLIILAPDCHIIILELRISLYQREVLLIGLRKQIEA